MLVLNFEDKVERIGGPKLLVRLTENSPEGGGAIDRGIMSKMSDFSR